MFSEDIKVFFTLKSFISSENHQRRFNVLLFWCRPSVFVWRVQFSWRISAETKPKQLQNRRFISFCPVTGRNVTVKENDRSVGGLCLSPFTIKSPPPPLPVCETSQCSLNDRSVLQLWSWQLSLGSSLFSVSRYLMFICWFDAGIEFNCVSRTFKVPCAEIPGLLR